MCTDLILPFEGENPIIISGRNTDFSPSPTITYPLFKVPVGVTYKGYTPKHTDGKVWRNIYGYVGISLHVAQPDEKPGAPINVANEGFLEGLNTEGLSVASLMLPYTEYVTDPSPEDYDRCVNANVVSQYLLGTCKDVDEVQQKLEEVVVWYPKAIEMFDALHLSVHDRNGKSLVVEFIDGQKNYYNNNEIGALANEPNFDWHAIRYNYFYNALTKADNNIDKYVRMTKGPDGRYNITTGTPYQWEVISSGMFGLPGDSSSPSRFIRAGKLRECVPSAYNARDGVQYALQILYRLAVCTQEDQLYYNAKGQPYDPRDNYNSTLWTSVRDHTNLIFYYATATNHNLQAIDLKDLDFSKGSKVTQTSIQSADWYANATSKLQ